MTHPQEHFVMTRATPSIYKHQPHKDLPDRLPARSFERMHDPNVHGMSDDPTATPPCNFMTPPMAVVPGTLCSITDVRKRLPHLFAQGIHLCRRHPLLIQAINRRGFVIPLPFRFGQAMPLLLPPRPPVFKPDLCTRTR